MSIEEKDIATVRLAFFPNVVREIAALPYMIQTTAYNKAKLP